MNLNLGADGLSFTSACRHVNIPKPKHTTTTKIPSCPAESHYTSLLPSLSKDVAIPGRSTQFHLLFTVAALQPSSGYMCATVCIEWIHDVKHYICHSQREPFTISTLHLENSSVSACVKRPKRTISCSKLDWKRTNFHGRHIPRDG